MHGARALEAVKQYAAFCLALRLRKNESQDQKAQHYQGEKPSHGGMGLFRAAQVVTPLKEQGPDPYADDQPEKAQDGVSVTAGIGVSVGVGSA